MFVIAKIRFGSNTLGSCVRYSRVIKTHIPRMKNPMSQYTTISPLPNMAEVTIWPALEVSVTSSSTEFVTTQWKICQIAITILKPQKSMSAIWPCLFWFFSKIESQCGQFSNLLGLNFPHFTHCRSFINSSSL
jgi:hypothetical protein